MSLKSSLLYQTGNVSSEPFILTGPVIGMVTANSARILIETNIACSVECVLKSPTNVAPDSRLTLDMPKRLPKCFEFTDLQPETYYSVELSVPVPGLMSSGFMTLPDQWSLMDVPARIAVVSGNNAAYTRDCVVEAGNLWKNLFKLAYKGQIDYLLHLGNNVCVDNGEEQRRPRRQQQQSSQKGCRPVESTNRWQEALNFLRGVSQQRSSWEPYFGDVCEIFRGVYRETWADPMVKQTLANVPNLMILNDREICEHFGASDLHHDPDAMESFLARAAYQVYNEYQRQLFDSVEPDVEINQAYHFHVFGDVGIMMIDTRVEGILHHCKHVDKSAALPVLGHRQWRAVEFALSDTGYFSGCRMLLVCTPTPPVAVSDGKNSCRGGEVSEAGHWFGGAHSPEASYFLAGLFDWRAKKPGLREVCILSGGLGNGFMSEILDLRYAQLGDQRVDRLKQIVVSPVADVESAPVEKSVLSRGGLTASSAVAVQSLSPYHQFRHFNNIGKVRSFAVLDIFLNYNDKLPQLGIQTCYAAQMTATNGSQSKSVKQVQSTQRLKGTFKSTYLGLCDGNKPTPPQAPLDWETLQNGDTVPAPPYDLRFYDAAGEYLGGTQSVVSQQSYYEGETAEGGGRAIATHSQAARDGGVSARGGMSARGGISARGAVSTSRKATKPQKQALRGCRAYRHDEVSSQPFSSTGGSYYDYEPPSVA